MRTLSLECPGRSWLKRVIGAAAFSLSAQHQGHRTGGAVEASGNHSAGEAPPLRLPRDCGSPGADLGLGSGHRLQAQPLTLSLGPAFPLTVSLTGQTNPGLSFLFSTPFQSSIIIFKAENIMPSKGNPEIWPLS